MQDDHAGYTEEGVSLHVGNLSRNVTEEHLREVFSTFGRLTRVDLQVDPAVGLSKGFAYIHYFAPADAEAAVLSMDGGQLDGNILKVSFILVSSSRRRRDSPERGGPEGSCRRELDRRGGRESPPPRSHHHNRGEPPDRRAGPSRGEDFRRPPPERQQQRSAAPRDLDRGYRTQQSRSPPRRRLPSPLPVRRRTRSPVRDRGSRERAGGSAGRPVSSRRSRSRSPAASGSAAAAASRSSRRRDSRSRSSCYTSTSSSYSSSSSRSSRSSRHSMKADK